MKSIIVGMIAAAGLVVAGGALATEMPPLAKKNGCTACHAIDHKVVGPAWMDVSKKYKGATKYTFQGKEYSLVEGLMKKVSQGGSGNWGAVPMIANDPKGMKQDEIKQLVEFELSLAK
jgi:cytochrome c